MRESLTQLTDALFAHAISGPAGVRPYVEAARAAIGAEMTLVVAGRRGVGKTTLINGLLDLEVGVPRFSAEDQPVQIISAADGQVRNGAVMTHLPATLLQGRRLIELPDASDGSSWRTAVELKDQNPDLLLYVAQQDLRRDELDLLQRSIDAWGLAPMDVLVVLIAPPWDGSVAGASGPLEFLGRRMVRSSPELFAQVIAIDALGTKFARFSPVSSRIARLERFCEARRTMSAVTIMADMATAQRSSAWAEVLRDAIERLQLAPEAHAINERWALEECLRGRTQLRSELRDDLIEFYLPAETSGAPVVDAAYGCELLTRRAARWRAEATRSSPRAAKVARIVVRSCQIRLDSSYTQQASIAPSNLQTREARYVHA
jgi:hypothetical protein